MTPNGLTHARGLGWKRSGPKPGDASARHLMRAGAVPDTATCRSQILTILDQKRLGSCVANATAQACRASMVRQGAVNPPLGSRLWLYYLARAYDHDTANDDGTYGRNAFMALQQFGLPPEEAWPYTDEGVQFTVMPSPSAFMQAFDQSACSSPRYYRLDQQGGARVDAVRQAISQGHCVVFGTGVTEDFCGQDQKGKIIHAPAGQPLAGGHELVIAEYDQTSFGIVNSWSSDWADGGWCRFSYDYIAWDGSDDFWIVDTSVPFSGGK